MIGAPDASFEGQLARRLRGTRKLAVVGIGDELHVADRLGVLAARAIEAMVIPGVRVFLAGTVPESLTAPIRRHGPDHVVLLDAAEMERPAGTLAIVGSEQVQAMGLSTHALPLSVVMDYLEKSIDGPVTLVGIQPEPNRSSADVTPAERAAISRLVVCVGRCMVPVTKRDAESIPDGSG